LFTSSNFLTGSSARMSASRLTGYRRDQGHARRAESKSHSRVMSRSPAILNNVMLFRVFAAHVARTPVPKGAQVR